MNANRVTILLIALAILVIVLAIARTGTASQLESVLSGSGAPTMVSYQGQVKVAGMPYNGSGYFKFAIWSGSGGNAWTNDGTAAGGGEPSASVPLTVSDGLFNVLLGDTSLPNMTALPASVFNETERYLRVWFSSDDTSFTLLSPDQRIAAVPYALQAEKTKGYANVVVVAKSGGDFTTINAALDSITTASFSNRYLVKVMPGVYAESVYMKEYVDIEGSGELNTKITHNGSSSLHATLQGANNTELRWLTVENTGEKQYAIAIHNESVSPRLKHITAIAYSGTYTYGVYNFHSGGEMTNMTAQAYHGVVNKGVYNHHSSSPVMTDVTAEVWGDAGSTNYGVYNEDFSSPWMTDVYAYAGGGEDNYGIYNNSSDPDMWDIRANASGWMSTNNYGVYNNSSWPEMINVIATAKMGNNNFGVVNTDDSRPQMTNVSAIGSGGTTNCGIYNINSSPVINQGSISASGGTFSKGVVNYASSTVIHNSVISASDATTNEGVWNEAESDGYKVYLDGSQITASSHTIYNDNEFDTYIGASLLSGGDMYVAGTLTCAGVYDENYNFYDNTCP